MPDRDFPSAQDIAAATARAHIAGFQVRRNRFTFHLAWQLSTPIPGWLNITEVADERIPDLWLLSTPAGQVWAHHPTDVPNGRITYYTAKPAKRSAWSGYPTRRGRISPAAATAILTSR